MTATTSSRRPLDRPLAIGLAVFSLTLAATWLTHSRGLAGQKTHAIQVDVVQKSASEPLQRETPLS